MSPRSTPDYRHLCTEITGSHNVAVNVDTDALSDSDNEAQRATIVSHIPESLLIWMRSSDRHLQAPVACAGFSAFAGDVSLTPV